MERFFINSPPQSAVVRVSGGQAHHMIRVKRIRTGQTVVLFDGSGAEWTARMECATKKDATLRILEKRDVSRELRCRITLACAPAKGEGMDAAVRKCAELGLARLIPTITQRTVAKPAPHRIQRWRRISIEASKQSGRNLITQIDDPTPFDEVLSLGGQFEIALMLDTSPEATPVQEALVHDQAAGSAICLIGPEGGFTQDERELAESAGFRLVRLVPSILTTEAAAITSLAMLAYALR